MNDYEYVKRFTSLSVSKMCKKLNIARSNIYKESVSKEKIKRLRQEIESEIAQLYILDINENKENKENKEMVTHE